ncbi:MAG: nucleotide exchange factor GrpE [Desulfuromonadales bacterium]|nr:nucleotide exchange factor GrpE [Desulfuromonadales bacterium]
MAKSSKQEQEQEETDINEIDAAIDLLHADNNDKQISELSSQLEQAQIDATAAHDQYLRTMADMDNLRKRTQREKEDLAKFANENILREILPVIDNLERAVEHAEQADDNDGLFEGVQMTLTQFSQLLEKFGVKTVDAIGQQFDPAYHQAMGQLESDEHPANTVIQQMQKGYQLNNRLLRPSFVMLAKAPAVAEAANDATTEDTDNE